MHKVKLVVHILVVLVCIKVYKHLPQEIYHLVLEELVENMDASVVAVVLVEVDAHLVKTSVVVVDMEVVVHLAVLAVLLVVGVVTKVVLVDNKDFLNIKQLIFHLVI